MCITWVSCYSRERPSRTVSVVTLSDRWNRHMVARAVTRMSTLKEHWSSPVMHLGRRPLIAKRRCRLGALKTCSLEIFQVRRHCLIGILAGHSAGTFEFTEVEVLGKTALGDGRACLLSHRFFRIPCTLNGSRATDDDTRPALALTLPKDRGSNNASAEQTPRRQKVCVTSHRPLHIQQVLEFFPGHYCCSGSSCIPAQGAQCGSRRAISALRTRTSPLREEEKGAGPPRFPASSVGRKGGERAALIRSCGCGPAGWSYLHSPKLQNRQDFSVGPTSPRCPGHQTSCLPAWRKFYRGRSPGQAQQAMVRPGFAPGNPTFGL